MADEGQLIAIHVASESGAPVREVDEVTAEAGVGLVGDRHHGSRHRHVTIIAAEDVDAAAEELGTAIVPGATRRNLTARGLPIPTTPDARIWVGEVALEVVRKAAPCQLMNEAIGPGAMGALHERGGAVCRLLSGGVIRVGDPIATAKAVEVVVHGLVQGVFFRVSTRDQAMKLGLTGWVRNDHDGSVQTHLEGRAGAVDQLVDWLRAGGPPQARVDDLTVIGTDPVGHQRFAITG